MSFGGISSADDGTSSAPPSFKAGKPRKTKDFIGSERKQREEGRYSGDIPPDIDPQLLNDSDTEPITAKVASLIYHYLEEGNAMVALPGPMDDEFHEAHFLRRRCCACWPRRASTQVVTVDVIISLISDVATSLYFCKQVIVLCAIYVERLVGLETAVILTSGNWRSIVVVGLLIASKVWEDVHPWNADFEDCLQEVTGLRYKQGALYRLESIFLNKLNWRVFVDGEEYAAYFFALLEKGVPRTRKPRDRAHSDTFMIDTIEEEATPPASPTLAQLPWSREDLAAGWKRDLLAAPAADEAGSLRCSSTRIIHNTWKLDKGNPHLGALRHAPRALAPSAHIPQSDNLVWAHEMVSRTTQMFGTPGAAHTLSGATGAWLESEHRRYLDIQRTHKGTP